MKREQAPPILLVAALSIGLLGAAPAQPSPPRTPEPPTVTPPPAAVAWVRAHAVPLPPEAARVNAAEAAEIDRFVQGARVIGLGEPGHGNHEPLAYRNRLVRYLVEHTGLTAVAMETGIAETRRLADYVTGGPGDPVEMVHRYFSWGFNEYPANVELMRWLRTWNANPAHRPVHLYGVDVSGGDDKARMGRARFALDDVLAFFVRTIPADSEEVRAELAPFTGRFSDQAYAAYTPQERASLTDGLAQAELLFVRHRADMVRASSPSEVAFAEREALDCRALERMFIVWPSDQVTQRPAPGDFEVVRIRDSAMADHLIWVLDQEGPNGRVLLFQADGHVRATSSSTWPMRPTQDPPPSTGEYLRARLGPAYRVMMTTSALGQGAGDARLGTLTRALAAAGPPRLLLDVRGALGAGWPTGVQSLTDHDRPGYSDVESGRTFDALVYFDRLTPEPPLRAAR